MREGAERPTVGVMGGLGPEATVDFFAKVVAASRTTGADRDQAHLHLLIDNDPGVPNRNDAIAGRGPSAGPALVRMARRLEDAGASFLVMVCNAAHAYEPDIRAATGVPFVSIVDETVAACLTRVPHARTVGVLAAAGCLDARLYETAFGAHGVRVVTTTGGARDAFMELLYRIKAGDKGPEVRSGMLSLAHALVAAGAEALVAGCTEVPLVLEPGDVPVPLVNSTDALVAATIAYARGERPLPGPGLSAGRTPEGAS